MSLTNVEKNISESISDNLRKHIDRFPAIRDLRENAYRKFHELGLPGNKHEEYRHAPLTRALEKNFNLSQSTSGERSAIKADDFFIPDLDAIHLVFVNGIYSEKYSTQALPHNLMVRQLADVLEKDPALVTSHLAKYADYSMDAFTAWNTAGWAHGLFIHVPDNNVIDKPVVIHTIVDAGKEQVINLTRNLIVVGKSAEVTIIQKGDSSGSHAHFSNTVTEAVLQENSGLNYYIIQNDGGHPHIFHQTTIYQTNHSRVNSFTFTLDGKFVRNNLQLILDGEGCESHMYGLYLLHNDVLADNHTVADHRKPNSFSNELYKGIMGGNSRGVFNGKIYVRPQAQKTNAFQANRNIILTDKATVNTKPQLEIWADDVKCSHGCTSGQLDEEALFYMQARGISKEMAQAILLYAFAGEVLEQVRVPALRSYLDKAVSERLNKTF